MLGELVISFSTGPDGRATLARNEASRLDRQFQGRSASEVLEIVPLVFNLCRMAQKVAAGLALGLPHGVTPSQLRDERLREGFARLGVFLPVALGRPPRPAPRVVFMSGAPAPDMARWLFGEAGVLPAPQDFDQWIERGQGVAELARDIRALYGEREGTVPSSDFTGGNAMEEGPFENSVAMRNAKHPLMRSVERRLGRGPLWRFVGILADMQAMLEGAEPECRYDAATGIAIVDAPRGVYALRACVVNGKVDVFERRTPTDHMAAPKGPLELGLSSLQHVTRQKVAVFVALCDPCLPVSIREGTHA